MSSSFLCYLGDVRVGATVLALTPMEEARPHATANSRRPFNDDLLLIGRRRFAFYDLLSTAPIRCPFYPLPRTLLILLAFLLFCIDMLVFFFSRDIIGFDQVLLAVTKFAQSFIGIS